MLHRVIVLGCSLASVCATAQALEGGEPDGEAHPYVGGLLYACDGEPVSYGCTGTLITKDTVVTAAHCVVGDDPPVAISVSPELRALPGAFADCNEVEDSPIPLGGDSRAVAVQDIFVHPDYTGEPRPNQDLTGLTQFFDVAILKLAERAGLDASPPSLFEGDLLSGAPALQVGFGPDGRMPASFAPVRLAAHSIVAEVADFEVVIGDETTPLRCPTDSGGPTFVGIDGDLALLSVTSRGHGPHSDAFCAPVIESRLSGYRAFIDEHVEVEWVSGTPGELPTDDPESSDVRNAGCSVWTRSNAGVAPLLWAMFGLLVAPMWRRPKR